MSDPLKSAMEAMDDYIAGLNHGDERAVNDACNFPHVRLAGGKVVVWNHHGDYKTRYDILVAAGDFSETTWSGPNFQFNDVNATWDLHLTGANVPDTIGVRDNLHVVAQIRDYHLTQELLHLDPVSTQVR